MLFRGVPSVTITNYLNFQNNLSGAEAHSKTHYLHWHPQV